MRVGLPGTRVWDGTTTHLVLRPDRAAVGQQHAIAVSAPFTSRLPKDITHRQSILRARGKDGVSDSRRRVANKIGRPSSLSRHREATIRGTSF